MEVLTKYVFYILSCCLVVNALAQKDDKDGCECGLFNSTKLVAGVGPLLSQKILPTGCDDAGEKNCMALCVNLAQLSKEKGPELICNSLGHVERLKSSIFSRACGKQWIYTGLSCDHEMCCHDKKQIDCETRKEIVPLKLTN